MYTAKQPLQWRRQYQFLYSSLLAELYFYPGAYSLHKPYEAAETSWSKPITGILNIPLFVIDSAISFSQLLFLIPLVMAVDLGMDMWPKLASLYQREDQLQGKLYLPPSCFAPTGVSNCLATCGEVSLRTKLRHLGGQI